MQPPKQSPNGEPGLDEVRWQVALSNYFYRKLKDLDVEYVPPLPDKITEAYYRQLLGRSRSSKPPAIEELFSMPFWLSPR